MAKPDQIPSEKKDDKEVKLPFNFGLNLAVGMGLFSYIGYKLDQNFKGRGYITLAGMFAGLLYCGYEVWKLVAQLNQEEKDKNAHSTK